MKVGRITCSDRASSGVYEDKGGPEIERVFSGIWPEPVEFIAKIIPDERAEIEAAVADWREGRFGTVAGYDGEPLAAPPLDLFRRARKP